MKIPLRINIQINKELSSTKEGLGYSRAAVFMYTVTVMSHFSKSIFQNNEFLGVKVRFNWH